jgi:hypothetical protein
MFICEVCTETFWPRVAGQRYCSRDCKKAGKAAEGRAARRLWEAAGRPKLNCTEAAEELRAAEGRSR